MCRYCIARERALFGRHSITRRQVLKAMLLFAAGSAVPHITRPWAGTPAQAAPRHLRPLAQEEQFDGARALQHAAAQLQFIPRDPGSEGSRMCGDYILAEWERQGWAVETQPFVYQGTNCRNLIAKRGSGPLLIIGAHYDTRRRADEDDDPARRNDPVPGANDGASGVAVLLELARILDPAALGRTIWLVAFDAEDNGRLDGWDWIAGSRYMAANLTETPQGMVLADMIGDADLEIYYERNSTPELSEEIWQVANSLGYQSFIPTPKWRIIDDHLPFLERGIPAANMIDFDYPYWHTTADTFDKLSAASLEAVGRTVAEWLALDAPGLPPTVPALARRTFLPLLWR